MLCACHCAMRDVLLVPLLVLITLVGVLLLRLRLDLRFTREPLIPHDRPPTRGLGLFR
jgi:hypothetical protein